MSARSLRTATQPARLPTRLRALIHSRTLPSNGTKLFKRSWAMTQRLAETSSPQFNGGCSAYIEMIEPKSLNSFMLILEVTQIGLAPKLDFATSNIAFNARMAVGCSLEIGLPRAATNSLACRPFPSRSASTTPSGLEAWHLTREQTFWARTTSSLLLKICTRRCTCEFLEKPQSLRDGCLRRIHLSCHTRFFRMNAHGYGEPIPTDISGCLVTDTKSSSVSTVTFMNAAAERLTGFKFEEISNSKLRSMRHRVSSH